MLSLCCYVLMFARVFWCYSVCGLACVFLGVVDVSASLMYSSVLQLTLCCYFLICVEISFD